MQIWYQWIPEGNAEWHEESQCPSMPNAGEDRHFLRSDLQNYVT